MLPSAKTLGISNASIYPMEKQKNKPLDDGVKAFVHGDKDESFTEGCTVESRQNVLNILDLPQ
jgi:hypothetical protein